ncbi:MAG: F0F1 ATP synthase subunit gamma [Clostridia bacterium]|nr:F0F1 ATP synthase subunit gamma [Clostridia bacterium]
MASLRELKKHLGSVKMTGQLAGAMKTVSAAKFSRIGAVQQRYAPYAEACRSVMAQYGAALSAAYPCADPSAPICFVILGSNRGLCGGYNAELYRFADEVLAACTVPYRLIVCGKTAIAHFRGAEDKIEKTFIFPDTAQYADCMPLFSCIRSLYTGGQISSVEIIGQRFVNMMTQTPARTTLLPLAADADPQEQEGLLYVPDRDAFLHAAAESCLSSALYAHLLDACAGAQAATLMAMRSAYDNAEQSAAALETVISRKRQSEVTASVIETSGGIFSEF